MNNGVALAKVVQAKRLYDPARLTERASLRADVGGRTRVGIGMPGGSAGGTHAVAECRRQPGWVSGSAGAERALESTHLAIEMRVEYKKPHRFEVDR